MAEGILDGKTALVAGVANKRSIAWAIAQALHGAGATARIHLPGRAARGIGAQARGGGGVERRGGVRRLRTTRASTGRSTQVGEELGGLDIMVHSIAYAPQETFANRFIDTPREAFATALDISAYSMIAMARGPSRSWRPAAAARW